MSEVSLYIQRYPNVDKKHILVAWNGQRGFAFDDSNQRFRELIILKVLENIKDVPLDLVFELFHEEAVWANITLTYRYYLTELVSLLLSEDIHKYGEAITRTFNENHHAVKTLMDVTLQDDEIEHWILQFKQMSKKSDTIIVDRVVDELECLLIHREEKIRKAEAFEAYVTHRDPWPIAFKKEIIRLWQQTEPDYLALFFIIPLVLMLGYYFFGLSILYGMLPMFNALIAIYIIYQIISWIIK